MTTQEQIKELFGCLKQQEQEALLKELHMPEQINKPCQVEPVAESCPYCMSVLIVKNGHRKGTQRYKCKGCYKTFTNDTGTLDQGIHKRDLYEEYKKLMFEGYLPLKKMAEKIGISIQTAFDWRHKILCGMKDCGANFDGITEIDDVWFLYSQKGRKGLKYSRKRGGSKRQGDNNFQVKLLVTVDRKSHRNLSVAKIGRITKADIERKIAGKFSEACTLVSDKHRSIAAFAKSQKIEHVSFKSSDHTAGGEYHVQNVNNMASRLKSIVNHRLRGVSTKYLQSYANWFELIEQGKQGQENKVLKSNSDVQAWNTFANVEKIYKQFIEKQSVRTYRCPTKQKSKSARVTQTHHSSNTYL